MNKNNIIIGGIYRHFKGNVYRVIAIANDCEDLHKVVVYQNVDKGDIWVRDEKNFCEQIERDGKTFDRFKFMNQGE